MKYVPILVFIFLMGCSDNRLYLSRAPVMIDGIEVYGKNSEIKKPYYSLCSVSARYSVFQNEDEFNQQIVSDVKKYGGNAFIVTGTKAGYGYLDPATVLGEVVIAYDASSWEIQIHNLLQSYLQGEIERSELTTKIINVVDDIQGRKLKLPN